MLKNYGQGPYANHIKEVQANITETLKRINEKMGTPIIDWMMNLNCGVV